MPGLPGSSGAPQRQNRVKYASLMAYATKSSCATRCTVCRKKKHLMKLTLVVPGLTWLDRHNGAETAQGLSLPALEKLLACASIVPAQQTVSQLLTEPFSVAASQLAQLAAQQAGLATDDAQHWLLASPVHLRLDLNRALLADSGIMRLDQREADTLIAALNQYFNAEGLQFYAAQPDQWLLRHDAIGDNVDSHRPTGRGGLYWNRILNDIQMLLFDHPLNQQREQQGDISINSIWLWGGGDGALAASPVHPPAGLALYGEHWITRLLAAGSGTPLSPTPADFADWLKHNTGGQHGLVWLDSLLAAAQYRDAWGWREAITLLEQNWFAPLLLALRRGQLSELNLVSCGEAGIHARLTRASLWKFWKTAQSLPGLYS